MKNIQNFLKNHIWGLLVHAWVPLQHTSNNWTQPEQTFYSTQTQDSTVRTLTDCPSCVFCIHSIKNKDSFKVEWLDLDYPVSSGGLTSSCFENLIRDLRSLTNQLTQTHRPSHVTDSTSNKQHEWIPRKPPELRCTRARRQTPRKSFMTSNISSFVALNPKWSWIWAVWSKVQKTFRPVSKNHHNNAI